MLLVPIRPSLAQGDRPQVCPDEACFGDAFAACQPAYFHAEERDAWYEIIEPAGDACRLSFAYERGQPLYFTATPSAGTPFMETMQQAIDVCMQGETSDCYGPFYDLPQAGAIFPATLQGIMRESISLENNPYSGVPFYYRAKASYVNPTTNARAVIDLIAVDAPFTTLFPPEIHGARKTALRLAPELRHDPEDLEEATLGDQTLYLEPIDDEGGMVAYVPLAEYALLRIKLCCGRTVQDFQALIAALDLQEFRSAATAYAEAGRNEELWSLLTTAPTTLGDQPLQLFRPEPSEEYEIELIYFSEDMANKSRNHAPRIMMKVSASALPLKEITMGMVTRDEVERGLAEGVLTQTTLAGREAYLWDMDEAVGVSITDGAHATLIALGSTEYISLGTLLEDLTEARIEAFFARAAAIVAEESLTSSDADASAPMCPDETCFEDAFAACRPARFRAERMGIVAAYEIIEPVGASCRLSLTYERNPNPEWVGQPLYFTATPSLGTPFMEAVQQALNACVQGEASNCDGPLYDLMQQ